MTYDTLIIGGGPAAVSAALTLRARNKTAAIVTGGIDDIPLSRSHTIANYPGMPDVSGREMMEIMEEQAEKAGVDLLRGRATSILNMGDTFGAAVGNDFFMGRTVILCTGAKAGNTFPGEKELLGRQLPRGADRQISAAHPEGPLLHPLRPGEKDGLAGFLRGQRAL